MWLWCPKWYTDFNNHCSLEEILKGIAGDNTYQDHHSLSAVHSTLWQYRKPRLYSDDFDLRGFYAELMLIVHRWGVCYITKCSTFSHTFCTKCSTFSHTVSCTVFGTNAVVFWVCDSVFNKRLGFVRASESPEDGQTGQQLGEGHQEAADSCRLRNNILPRFQRCLSYLVLCATSLPSYSMPWSVGQVFQKGGMSEPFVCQVSSPECHNQSKGVCGCVHLICACSFVCVWVWMCVNWLHGMPCIQEISEFV